MRNKKLSKVLLFVIPFLILSIGLLGLPFIEAFVLNTAPSTSPTVITPTTILNFRDVENLANSTSSVIILGSSTLTSSSETIRVTDKDANVDLTAQDFVFVTVNSTTSGLAEATVFLRETNLNTGIFEGVVTLTTTGTTSGSTLQVTEGDSLTTIYLPFPYTTLVTPVSVTGGSDMDRAMGRMSASIAVTSGSGSITLSDNTEVGVFDCNWTLVTYPVIVDLPPGMVTSSINVTISYADALFQGAALNPNGAPPLLRILHADIGASTFTALTPDLPGGATNFLGTTVDLSGHSDPAFNQLLPDFTTKITNIDQPPSVEGQYAIGFFDAGCSGGGGGGLVRPGLVVNALAGIGAASSGGGGGGLPGPTIALGAVALNDNAVERLSVPQEIRDIVLDHDPHTPLEPIADIYEDFDFPLSINGNGFALAGYENTLVSQTVEPGKPIEFTLVFYTTSEIAFTSLNFNLGPTRLIAGSDTQVLLYKDKFEIVDPNGNIATATGSINNEGDLKRVATFSITFSEDIQWSNSDLVLRSWNDNLNSGDIIVYDAIHVAPSVEEIAFEQSLPEPEVEQLKSQHVPIWIKNNAAWWSQELIEDSDFVAGIEYLIQQEIITLTDTGKLETNSSDEIPTWIKNNAGWWSEDLITEKEFIDGLQWLISNGIIKVAET